MNSRSIRKWLMIVIGAIWSWVTFERGQEAGWNHPRVWSTACLAALFFLQGTIDPDERPGYRDFLRNPKRLLILGLLVASVVLMFIGRR